MISVPLWEPALVSIMGNYEVFGVLTAILSSISIISVLRPLDSAATLVLNAE
jgi:hypothetical protein